MFQKIAKKLALIFGSKLIKKVKISIKTNNFVRGKLISIWTIRKSEYEMLEKEVSFQSNLQKNLIYNASRLEELSRCILDLQNILAEGEK